MHPAALLVPTTSVLHVSWHQLRKVLREFAYFTRISDEDLEKERKVVLEDASPDLNVPFQSVTGSFLQSWFSQEWRESRSAQGRLSERYIQAVLIVLIFLLDGSANFLSIPWQGTLWCWLQILRATPYWDTWQSTSLAIFAKNG